MAVNFPLNPVDEQRYPDLVAGDPPLDNGRVYVYDAAKRIWNIDTGEGSGEFLLKHGHIVDDCTTPVVYSWNQNTTFKVDGSNEITIDAPNGDFTVNSDWTYINAKEKAEVRADLGIVLDSSGDIEVSAGDNYSELINRTIEDTARKEQITNKEYVDQRDELLQNKIVELAEEIDAIAPSVERGAWQMTLSGVISGPGLITFYDDTFSNGSPIGVFAQVQSVWFSQTDNASVPHGFENVEPGYLLELFVQGEDDYGLFEVVKVHDQTTSPDPYYAIDVNFVRALNDTSKADNNDLVRMKTFQAPTGGTADGFVLKTGDDIPCDSKPISFPNEYSDSDLKTSVSNVQAYVRFTSKNTDDSTTQTVNIFQPGNVNAVMTNGNLYSKQNFYGKGLKGFDSTNETKPSIDISTDNGFLHHDGTKRVSWHSNGGSLMVHTTNIFGWKSTNSIAYKPIQFYDTDTNTDDDHAIHKGYVDDEIAALLARIEELEKNSGTGSGETMYFDPIVTEHTFELKSDSNDPDNWKLFSTTSSNAADWANNADRIWQIAYGNTVPSNDYNYSAGFFLPQPWLDKQGLKFVPSFYSYSYWLDFETTTGYSFNDATGVKPKDGYPKAETFYGVPGYTFLFSDRIYAAGNSGYLKFTWRNKFHVVTNRMDILEHGTALGPDEPGEYFTPILKFSAKNKWSSPTGDGTSSSKITFNSDNYHQNSTTAYYEYEALYDGTVYFREKVSSEERYDKGIVYINENIVVGPRSGSTSWEDHIFELKKGDKLKFEYSKDGSDHNNNDRFYVKYLWSEGYVPRENVS